MSTPAPEIHYIYPHPYIYIYKLHNTDSFKGTRKRITFTTLNRMDSSIGWRRVIGRFYHVRNSRRFQAALALSPLQSSQSSAPYNQQHVKLFAVVKKSIFDQFSINCKGNQFLAVLLLCCVPIWTEKWTKRSAHTARLPLSLSRRQTSTIFQSRNSRSTSSDGLVFCCPSI